MDTEAVNKQGGDVDGSIVVGSWITRKGGLIAFPVVEIGERGYYIDIHGQEVREPYAQRTGRTIFIRDREAVLVWNPGEAPGEKLEEPEAVPVSSPADDIVKQPSHYTRYKIEPITFIMQNGLDFETGNVVKYACRAGHKLYPSMDETQSAITDWEKVRRYAEMKINLLKGKEVL